MGNNVELYFKKTKYTAFSKGKEKWLSQRQMCSDLIISSNEVMKKARVLEKI